MSDRVGIDIAILSKIERGERKISKAIVQKLAAFYGVDAEPLIISALNEQLLQQYGQDELGQQAIMAAEQQVAYRTRNQSDREQVLRILIAALAKELRIEAAWLFGSFARGEETASSDVDILVRFNSQVKVSLFDMIDIQVKLESLTNRKIDLIEEGTLLPFAQKTAIHDLKQIK